eukprot:gene31357-37896_t
MSNFLAQTEDVQIVQEKGADEEPSLVVRKTTLPGCDFDGLFTTSKVSRNETICKYFGKVLRTVEAMRLDDKSYLMRLGEQCYIDAREDLSCYARYINDCINPRKWNMVLAEEVPCEASVIRGRELSEFEVDAISERAKYDLCWVTRLDLKWLSLYREYKEAFSEISKVAGLSTNALLACPVHASTVHHTDLTV